MFSKIKVNLELNLWFSTVGRINPTEPVRFILYCTCMLAEIITIGDEILIGQVVDTNSAWMAEQLNLIGIQINRLISVSDNRIEILTALEESASRSNLILVTGGLGPTKDDITKPAICEYFNTRLVIDPQVLEHVEKFLSHRGVAVNELNRLQAMVPENAKVLHNALGTAPGLWFIRKGVVYVFMPGVPFEMKKMMQDILLPLFQQFFKTPPLIHKTILTTGIAESTLAETIEPWEDTLPKHFRLAYLPSPGMVRLRITARGKDMQQLELEVQEQLERLQQLIPHYIFGYDEDTLEIIIGKLLKDSNKTISTAESCTGGNMARLITSVPGASGWFKGSIVAYDNRVKQELLNVSEADLLQYGAVSQQVAEAMAVNVREKLHTDFSVAVTGIAGPDGGTPEKPVGLVWVAVAKQDKVISKQFKFGDNRERNITRTTISALNLLATFIKSSLSEALNC